MKIRDIHSLQLVYFFIEQEHFFLSPYLAGKASLKTTEREEKKWNIFLLQRHKDGFIFRFEFHFSRTVDPEVSPPPTPH
jgi:hypothetical protein